MDTLATAMTTSPWRSDAHVHGYLRTPVCDRACRIRVKALSGGERNRLYTSAHQAANVLSGRTDNDLDLETLELLVQLVDGPHADRGQPHRRFMDTCTGTRLRSAAARGGVVGGRGGFAAPRHGRRAHTASRHGGAGRCRPRSRHGTPGTTKGTHKERAS